MGGWMGGEVGGGGRALGRELCLCCGVRGLSLALGDAGKGIWAWGVDMCSCKLWRVGGIGEADHLLRLECWLEMRIGDCKENKEMSLKMDFWGGK